MENLKNNKRCPCSTVRHSWSYVCACIYTEWYQQVQASFWSIMFFYNFFIFSVLDKLKNSCKKLLKVFDFNVG